MEPLRLEAHIAKYAEEICEIFHPDTGVRTIEQFVLIVGKISERFLPDDDKVNQFKGDMLELLSEIFFGAFHADPKVGIIGYTPVPISEDYGVDATGTNVAGNACVVQCKLRSDPSEAITYEDMSKTYTAGRLRHHLSLEAEDTTILFTTCNSVSGACKEVFGTTLRVISRSIISQRIDNNPTFWAEAEQRLDLTFQKIFKTWA